MFNLPTTPDTIVRGLVLSSVALIWIIALIRLIGTRALSKMTAFDFVVTLSTGSLLATAAASSSWPSFAQAIIAITVLNGIQYALARARRESDSFKNMIENEPLLLVREGQFLESAMRRARVSRDDVRAKVRKANVGGMECVAAVILETTGDISIISGDTVPPELLVNVRTGIGEASPGS